MNKRFDPNENRSVNPAAWPSEQAGQRIDPVTSAPTTDPLATQRRADPDPREPRTARSSWPILIILLAGLVLALLVWLPSEMATDQTNDAATQPAPTDTTTPPAADDATPATPDTSAAPPAPDTSATPDTSTAPAAPATPAPDTSATPATPATPETGTAPAPAQPAPAQ